VLVLVIVLGLIVLLALLIGFGGFGGGGYWGGYGGPGGPTTYRRIIYRRPARRVVTERRIVDDVDPVDGPVYRP
jgi:hypothetical protein